MLSLAVMYSEQKDRPATRIAAAKARDYFAKKTGAEPNSEDYRIQRADAEQQMRERKAEFDAARREHVAAMNIRVSQAVNKLETELSRVGAST